MNWYKTLNWKQRFALRECCQDIVGITWEQLGLLFSFRERVEILHQKLQLEGFNL